MMKQWILASVVGAAVLAAAQPAMAHRTWLLPSVGVADDKGAWVTFDAAVSEDLFVFGNNAVQLTGLAITGPDGKPLTAQNTFTGKLRSSFDLQLTQEGTYRISLVNENAMGSYKLGTEMKRVRGLAADIDKQIPKEATDVRISITESRLETFVAAGRGNDTVLQPAGKGLEVLPLTSPDNFVPGEPVRFRALLNGQPLPDLTVAVVPGGVRHRGVLREQAFKTDAKGEFTFSWPEAGLYAVTASYPPRPAGGPQSGPQGGAPGAQGGAPVQAPAAGQPPARRYSYSATLEVLPE